MGIYRLGKGDIEAVLLQYEKDFFNAEFCCNKNNLERRLSEDFYEIGSSGKRIRREEVIHALSELSEDRKIAIIDFKVDMLDDSIALVRYKANQMDTDKVSWRSSIWKRQGCDWVMFYHQGTICD